MRKVKVKIAIFSIIGFQCVARKYKRMIKDLYFIFLIQPKLAKYSQGGVKKPSGYLPTGRPLRNPQGII